jgi:VCBS repeat-containing protein
VALSADGGFSYTPTLRFSGNDWFTYEVSDGQDGTDIGTVTLIPSVCFAAQALLPGGAPSLWPPNGDFETATLSVPDGATITDVGVFQDEPVGRKVDAIIDSTTSVQLRAERLGSGDGRVYHILITVDDGMGEVHICTLKIGVVPHDHSGDLDAVDGGPLYDSTIPGNIPPQTLDDQYTTDEDTLLSVAAVDGVLSNDVDWDEDPLTVAAVNGDPGAVGFQVTLPSNALLTLNGDGSYVYDPDGQFEYLAVGETFTDTFTYQASDSIDVSTATVSISITGVNDTLTASDDSGEGYTTDEDTAFTTANVLVNDTDPDTSDILFVDSIDTTGTLGLVTDNGDGTFNYDPNGQFEYLAAGETTTDTFTYTASDGNGATDTATVTITITGVDENNPPDAMDDQNVTDENTVLSVNAANGVLFNDGDVDGDPLTVTAVNGDANAVNTEITLPSGALLMLNGDGSYDYDPNGQFEALAVGETASDTFTYTISDGKDGTDTATVTITINGVNDTPIASDDSGAGYTTDEDTAFTTANVLDNDTDPDTSDTLFIVSIDTTGIVGLVTDNGDGTFDYDPNGQFEALAAGETALDIFTYTVSDGNSGTDTATVTIAITGLDENIPPVANDDSATTLEDTPVTIYVDSNDTDDNGNLDPSSATVVSGPANGMAMSNGDGTFTYTPNENFYGTDSFIYQICDTDGACDTATVTITVEPVNDAPDAQDDAYTMKKGQTLIVDAPGVLDNDIDIEGAELNVTAVNGVDADVGIEITLPSGALLTLNANGSFLFTPRPNFRGEDLFTYTVSDGNSGSDTATVLITVVMPND